MMIDEIERGDLVVVGGRRFIMGDVHVDRGSSRTVGHLVDTTTGDVLRGVLLFNCDGNIQITFLDPFSGSLVSFLKTVFGDDPWKYPKFDVRIASRVSDSYD